MMAPTHILKPERLHVAAGVGTERALDVITVLRL
jgi:hypothetical protein